MDTHPTIDILSAPPNIFPNPVYNCIEYCFRANDYLLISGQKAAFIIGLGLTPQPDGLSIAVAGKPFVTLTPGGLGTFSWQGSIGDYSNDFVRMLTVDYYFGSNFVTQYIPVFGIVFSQAIKAGLIQDWYMDFSAASPSISASLNNPGADAQAQKNYRLVIEIWTCLASGIRDKLITTRGYEPDMVTSELCIDISKVVRPLVHTTFPGLSSSLAIILDPNIMRKICLRYGEIYADSVGSCEAQSRFFELGSPIDVINSAFQKDDLEGMEPFAFDIGGLQTRFLTNRPQYTDICTDSFAWLWYIFDEQLAEFIALYPTLIVQSQVIFTYTNNSTSKGVIETIPSLVGVYYIPTGLAQIGVLATPGLVISHYEIIFGVDTDPISLIIPIAERFHYVVADKGFCCCHEEFYFLSEPGGFDTMLFNCIREVDLEYQATEFFTYEPCEGDILEGGKEEAETKAYEIHRTTSRYLDTYNNINWVREFLKSPKRYWRKDGKVYKIKLLSDQIELRRKDGFIYIQIEFILSFELNQQQN